MTNEQKAMIRKLRQQNNSYVSIAGVLGVSVSAVKGYCQRNGLSGKRANADSSPDGLSACLGCGKPITQRDGIKRIKFCSPGCRRAWWNAHPEKVNRKAVPLTGTVAGSTAPMSAISPAASREVIHDDTGAV